MKKVRQELTEQLGKPTAQQRMLIERCAILSLRCAQFDKAIAAGDLMTERETNYALAWANALQRALDRLGLELR